MPLEINADDWVYVLIQNPGAGDSIVGRTDAENDIAFIPLFLDKDTAGMGVVHIPKEKGNKYEIQAMIFDDLERYAAENNMLLFVIDDEGKVIDKRVPGQ